MTNTTDASLFCQRENEFTLNRRRLLQGMLATGGAAALGVSGLADAALAGPAGPNDPILVTLMLGGGNDGLNTLAPVDSGIYKDLRSGTAVSRSGAHSVGSGLFLHPKLAGLKQRFDNGDVAIVRGVGEPGRDHSHFLSLIHI